MGRPRIPELDLIGKINRVGGVRFLSWDGDYVGAHTNAILECEIDGFVWSARASKVCNKYSGCPQCGGVRKWTEEDRTEQINSIDGIRLNKIVGEFVGDKTKIICGCISCGNSWETSICSVISHSSRCPFCASHGYKKSKNAVLYALMSKCGTYIKVGISNDHKTRHATLKRRTPFEWHCLHSINASGGEAQRLEAMLHSKYERAVFGFRFDGYTEWLICTPELLEEIRSIANGNS